MKKFFLTLVAISLIAASCNSKPNQYTDGSVRIGASTIKVDVAATTESRDLGLGGRTDITDGQGMWFVFDAPDRYSFWMKDMNFPIDIIWLKSNQVVQISPNLPIQPKVPDIDLVVYTPDSAVDRVLELRAGWAAEHALKIGDQVEFTAAP